MRAQKSRKSPVSCCFTRGYVLCVMGNDHLCELGTDLVSMAQASDKFQEQMDSMARRLVRALHNTIRWPCWKSSHRDECMLEGSETMISHLFPSHCFSPFACHLECGVLVS